MAGQCSRDTQVCPGAPRPLRADKEGQIRRLSHPYASRAEGLPSGAGGGCSVGSGGELPLFLQSQAWQTEQLR